MTSLTDLKSGDRISERYLVHDTHIGSVGEIYFCQDLQTKQPRVLKTLRIDLRGSADANRHLKQEAEIWIALGRHPHIVRCYGVEERENRVCLVLEWVTHDQLSTTSLADHLRRAPLDPRDALHVGIDIARALDHMARVRPGLVHCDIKPANILLSIDGRALLSDFGLATTTAQDTGRGGTPAYMAPEQWNNTTLDPRTDIYALGCTLYELLTGHAPFSGDNLTIRDQHLQASVPAMPEHVPAKIATLVGRCMVKDPAHRFAHANALLAALSNCYSELYDVAPREITRSDELRISELAMRALSYVELKQYDLALADCNHLLALSYRPELIYSLQGSIYEKQERYDLALEANNRAIALQPSAGAYLGRGNIYRVLGNYQAALADYTTLIEINPQLHEAYACRALVYHNLGNIEQALADFAQALQLDPDNAGTYVNRAEIYRQLGRFDQARADLERALELRPNHPSAQVNYGLTLAHMGAPQKAVAVFTQVLEQTNNPAKIYYNRGLALYHLGRYAEAIDDYSRAYELDPNGDTLMAAYRYAHLNNRAATLAVIRRYEEALADYDLLVTYEPDSADNLFNRGMLNYQLERMVDAEADLLRVIDLEPESYKGYLGLGMVLIKVDRLSEALPYIERATELGAPNGMWHANQLRAKIGMQSPEPSSLETEVVDAIHAVDSREAMAWVFERYRDQANFSLVVESLRIVVKQLPLYASELRERMNQQVRWLLELLGTDGEGDRPARLYGTSMFPGSDKRLWSTHKYLSEAERLLNEGQLHAALQVTQTALESDPHDAGIYFFRAQAFLRLGEDEQALQSLDQSIAFDPSIAEVHSYRGILLARLGQIKEALASHMQAVTLAPNSAQTQVNYGLVLNEAGRYTEAMQAYQRAVASEPTYAYAWFKLGSTAHQHLGEEEVALDAYSRSIALDPSFAFAFSQRATLLRRRGDHQSALADMDRAVALEPNDAGLRALRGSIYAMFHHYAEARADLEQAITLDPYLEPLGSVHYNLGITLLALNLPREACMALEEAVNFDFAPAIALLHKARAQAAQIEAQNQEYALKLLQEGKSLLAADRDVEALEVVDKVTALAPGLVEAYKLGMQIAYRLDRYELVLHYAIQLLHLNEDVEAAMVGGAAAMHLERYEEAVRLLSIGLAAGEKDAVAFYNRGLSYQHLRNYNAALLDYERAIRCDKFYVLAYNNRGTVYRILGNDRSAIENWLSAIKINPIHPAAYHNLAMMLLEDHNNLRDALPLLISAARLGDIVSQRHLATIERSGEHDFGGLRARAFIAMLDAHTEEDLLRVLVQFPMIGSDEYWIALEEWSVNNNSGLVLQGGDLTAFIRDTRRKMRTYVEMHLEELPIPGSETLPWPDPRALQEASHLSRQANIAAEQERGADALRLYQQARVLLASLPMARPHPNSLQADLSGAVETGRRLLEALICNNAASLFYQAGYIAESLRLSDQAATNWEICDQPGDAGQILTESAAMCDQQGLVQEAIERYIRGTELLHKAELWFELARELGNLAMLLQRLGRLEDAVSVLWQSLQLRVELGDDRGAAASVRALMIWLHKGGRHEASLKICAQAQHLLASAQSLPAAEADVLVFQADAVAGSPWRQILYAQQLCQQAHHILEIHKLEQTALGLARTDILNRY